MANLELSSIAVDCPDPARLARFYADLLGVEAEGECIHLFDGGLQVWFQKVDTYHPPTWPTQERGQQMHFDLFTDDRETEVVRAVAMGASIASEDAESFTVMLDPAGHPFCICDAKGSA